MPGSRGMPGRSLASAAASPYLRRLYDVADAVATLLAAHWRCWPAFTHQRATASFLSAPVGLVLQILSS